MTNKETLMNETYVEIRWCPADVKSIREDWSDEKCMEALDKIAHWFEDRSIELGWEALDNLLNMEYGYDNDEEEEEEDA